MDSFLVIIAAVIAFAVTAIIGKWFIPYLRKINFGQNIIEEYGPTWHKSKQGTPIMGGLMFIIGIIAAVVVSVILLVTGSSDSTEMLQPKLIRLIIGIVMALAFGFLGFVDDYTKVAKGRNLGLTAKQKFIMQLLIGALYLAGLYITDRIYGTVSTVVTIPFIPIGLDLGFLYYLFALIVVVGFVNAANLTDGIDGLCSSVTFVASLGSLVIAAILSVAEVRILSAALAGGTLGFLIWNFHPAKVFMGDTGSMFLGGMVVAICFGLGQPLLLVLVGIIYLAEALSVMLQVASVKLRKKRIFKMSPIHHHFEMSGWSEVKIVVVFSLVTLIGCLLAIGSVLLGL